MSRAYLYFIPLMINFNKISQNRRLVVFFHCVSLCAHSLLNMVFHFHRFLKCDLYNVKIGAEQVKIFRNVTELEQKPIRQNLRSSRYLCSLIVEHTVKKNNRQFEQKLHGAMLFFLRIFKSCL